jgi:cobalt/nickel transport system permease protein
VHIADGILTAPVAAASAVLAAAGIGLGLRKLDADEIPRVGMLAAVLFVASLIHVPVGFSNAHLLMNGLAGLLLGWGAFPAMCAALFLQAILFNFGGLVSLGANTLNAALPAVLSYYLFAPRIRTARSYTTVFFFGACGGAVSVFGTGVMLSLSLLASGGEFAVTAWAVLAAHVPIMLAEAFVTGAAVRFLAQVRPETLSGRSVAI